MGACQGAQDVKKPVSKIIMGADIKANEQQSYASGKMVFKPNKTKLQEGGPTPDQLRKDRSRQDPSDDVVKRCRVSVHEHQLELINDFMEPWLCNCAYAVDTGC